jgi:Trk K+ transport system NAD-binding subunit
MVATTSDDLVNIAASLHARAVRPDLRVVVRLYDPEFAVRVQRGLGMRFTRSVSHLAAPAFAAAATGSQVVASVPVGDRRVVLFARVQVLAAADLAGREAGTIDQPGERRLLAIVGADGRARWYPRMDEPLVPGSELVVAATRQGLADLLQQSHGHA